jgi:hypothetical protein
MAGFREAIGKERIMSVGFFPRSDSALLAWSLNYSTLIYATPTAYGLTAGQATAYAAVHMAYANALAACDPNMRSKTTVAAKNSARTNLKINAKLLASTINGVASVTDAQKIGLGLNVRALPTPIPPPSSAPVLDVKLVSGWTVKIKLHDSTSGSKRGRPVGVFGASVFSFVGAEAPTDLGTWKFEGNTGQTLIDLAFASALAPGTKVWMTAFWFNGSKQSGPPCAPVSANLPGGSVSMAA